MCGSDIGGLLARIHPTIYPLYGRGMKAVGWFRASKPLFGIGLGFDFMALMLVGFWREPTLQLIRRAVATKFLGSGNNGWMCRNVLHSFFDTDI